jgi:3-oxoacyl-[acyl-carrier-protein] synthase I
MSAAGFAPVAVTGIGAISPVGSNAEQTCASIRAGIMGLAEHLYYQPTTRDPGWDDEEPLLAAPVGSIDPFLGGRDRLLELATSALMDLAGNAGLKRKELPSGALLVSLPASDPVVDGWSLAREFLPSLRRRAGLSAFKVERTAQTGQSGMLELIRDASALLSTRAVDFCVLLGADSYLSGDRMELLDAAYRIKSVRNVDGFVPGEAATALLLETPRRAAERGRAAHAVISGLGFGVEPETEASDKQSTGAGLCQALRALSSPPGTAAEWILCDLNGESYRSFEWGVTMTRLGAELGGVKQIVHPASSFGDIGAAIGGALVAVAAAAFRRGYAPAREATLWTSGAGAVRAAARLQGAE